MPPATDAPREMPLRVLLVDDSPSYVGVIRRAVAAYGLPCEINDVASGEECLERLTRSSVDLVLLDYHLPGMDGLAVLHALQARGLGLPVVMITGMGNEEVAARALALGAADYLIKSESIASAVPPLLRRFLGRARTEVSLRASPSDGDHTGETDPGKTVDTPDPGDDPPRGSGPETAATAPPAARPEDPGPLWGRGKWVLVVDDETDVREYVQELLVEVGCEVMVAADGRVAIELVRSRPPDLILLDFRMPEVDGLTALRALKTSDQTARIPVWMLTAGVDHAAREEAIEWGAGGVILKPFHPDELLSQVRSLLQGAGGAAGAGIADARG